MTLTASCGEIGIELFQRKNDYDALLEKYQELMDAYPNLDR